MNLRIALAQMNPTVGALAANAGLIRAFSRQALEQGAQLVVFPELALVGYPPEDLVLKKRFQLDCEEQVRHLAAALPPELAVVTGAPLLVHNTLRNAAVVLHGGQVRGVYSKMVLPNYGVFDEYRHFSPGEKPFVLDLGLFRLGLHICEDSWRPDLSRVDLLQELELDALLNLSASPYARGKARERLDALRRTTGLLGCPMLYCNLVGGQDELVFDGESLLLLPGGQTPQRAAQFKEDMLHVTLERPQASARPDVPATVDHLVLACREAPAAPMSARPSVCRHEPCREVYEALTLGLRDYVDKNGFKRVVVALSGGIDSALVIVLAVDALGADRISAVTMPSPYTSGETLADAKDLAGRLGVDLLTIPIKDVYQRYLDELSPLWPDRAPDTTEENLQARIRGAMVMALSNKFGWLVLTTGNKSELATGYCTIYGDMAGGFAVIKDVPKMLVFELCKWRNEQGDGEIIPVAIIERPPSAELRPDQKDSDSLPPYELLDAILERYVEQDRSVAEIIADGFDEATTRRIVRLVDLNEYKRRQAPPGIKITPKAFGRDRRMPITNAYRN